MNFITIFIVNAITMGGTVKLLRIASLFFRLLASLRALYVPKLQYVLLLDLHPHNY